MKNPRLAGRYAKSLIVLAIEQNNLDVIFNDIKLLESISKSNPDFVTILKSPVIASDKKEKIISAVLDGNVNSLTSSFLQLLTRKTRESNLPEIIQAFIEQYNEIKEIQHVKLSTATAIGEDLKTAIVNKIKTDTGIEKIELETIVDEELIGGLKLEMRGNLVDATILKDMKDLKRQFLDNSFVFKMS